VTRSIRVSKNRWRARKGGDACVARHLKFKFTKEKKR